MEHTLLTWLVQHDPRSMQSLALLSRSWNECYKSVWREYEESLWNCQWCDALRGREEQPERCTVRQVCRACLPYMAHHVDDARLFGQPVPTRHYLQGVETFRLCACLAEPSCGGRGCALCTPLRYTLYLGAHLLKFDRSNEVALHEWQRLELMEMFRAASKDPRARLDRLTLLSRQNAYVHGRCIVSLYYSFVNGRRVRLFARALI